MNGLRVGTLSQYRAPMVGLRPRRLRKFRQLAEQHFHELLRRHRRAVRMSERRTHHGAVWCGLLGHDGVLRLLDKKAPLAAALSS
jgi:hypothetical protein